MVGTTGTYSFAPSAADITLNAFGMIGIRRAQLTQDHLQDAYMAANFLMVDFTNRSPNRWTMETQDQILSASTPTYDLTARTLAIAIAYLDTTTGGVTTSRVIGPISATDYASISNKLQEGPPTSYFLSLLTTPTVTVWPVVPSTDTTTYTLRMQTFRQNQDVQLANGVGIDAPYRFLDAFSTGMAARLKVLYPEKAPPGVDFEGLFEKRFKLAAQTDQEKTPLYISPQMGGYYR